jgi:hypothetical protein
MGGLGGGVRPASNQQAVVGRAPPPPKTRQQNHVPQLPYINTEDNDPPCNKQISRHKTSHTNVRCPCGFEPSFDHCLQCPNNKTIFKEVLDKLKDINIMSLDRVYIQNLARNHHSLLSEVAWCIYESPLGDVL